MLSTAKDDFFLLQLAYLYIIIQIENKFDVFSEMCMLYNKYFCLWFSSNADFCSLAFRCLLHLNQVTKVTVHIELNEYILTNTYCLVVIRIFLLQLQICL